MLTIRFHLSVGLLIAALIVLVGPATAQPSRNDPRDHDRGLSDEDIETVWIPTWRLGNGTHIRAAFRPVVSDANRATVRVRVDGSNVALGGIVDPDGWVVTKASQLGERITCLLRDGRELEAHLVDVDSEHDLALLKIDARRLPTLKLDDLSTPEVGTWIATAGPGRNPAAVGIISVGPRQIAHRPGVLGVRLGATRGGASVLQIFPLSAALEAGIQNGDVLISVEGEATPSRESFIRAVRSHSPGDKIEIGVRRDEESLVVLAVLGERFTRTMSDHLPDHSNLGGPLSQRRFSFPSAFQHDTVLEPTDCGGPVVDLDGNVLGLNIARSGRTESYAIPTSVLVEVLARLQPGETATTAVSAGAAP